MTWGRLLAGLGLVVATALAFLLMAGVALVARPNGLGLLLALGAAFAGAEATRSVWRDRL